MPKFKLKSEGLNPGVYRARIDKIEQVTTSLGKEIRVEFETGERRSVTSFFGYPISPRSVKRDTGIGKIARSVGVEEFALDDLKGEEVFIRIEPFDYEQGIAMVEEIIVGNPKEVRKNLSGDPG